MASSAGNIIDERTLKNGLQVFFRDESHPIAGGFWQVVLVISIPVEVLPKYFKDLPDPEGSWSAFTAAHGKSIDFRQAKVRNFVAAEEKGTLLATMKDEFLTSSATYLENPGFASKFVLKAYADWREKTDWESSYQEALGRSSE